MVGKKKKAVSKKKIVSKPKITMFNIVVGRLADFREIKVPIGTTVNQAFAKVNLRSATNEAIQDDIGNTFTGSELVEDNREYYLIKKVKLGSC